MISTIFPALCILGLILSTYLLIRNSSTHSILKDCCDQWGEFIGDNQRFLEARRIVKRYSYDKILFSFRPISSFQRELNKDMAKVRISKREEKYE